MPAKLKLLTNLTITLILLGLSARMEGAREIPATEAEAWFEEDDAVPVPQVGAGEVMFLDSPPAGRILYSENRISLSGESVVSGWASIEQCYTGMDAVAKTEIVYRYRNMRKLRIRSLHDIRAASLTENSVRLNEVGVDASLCVQLEARILHETSDEQLILRNGPFQRKFLDGYFPMHVSLEVSFPAHALQVVDTMPRPQSGVSVTEKDGRIVIDSWFAGSLMVEIVFARTDER